MSALSELRDGLRAQGGLLAAAARDELPEPAEPRLGAAAAAGPRAAADRPRYERLVEAIREGYLLHYDRPRVMTSDDADLALLAGDQLYARGLAELAELRDLEAVTELADVISLAAAARAAGDRELAEAVWAGGATAVGHGADASHQALKLRARNAPKSQQPGGL